MAEQASDQTVDAAPVTKRPRIVRAGNSAAVARATLQMMRKPALFAAILGAFLLPATVLADGLRDARRDFLKARSAVTDGRFRDALELYRKVIEELPEDAVVRYEYAQLLRDLNVPEEAGRQAREAVRLDPSLPEAHRLLGTLELAASEKDPSRLDAAIAELQKAHQLIPYDAATSAALARALLAHGQPAEAARVLDDMPESRTQPGLMRLAAEARARSGRTRDAEGLYEALHEADPNDREAVAALVDLYEEEDRLDDALALLHELEAKDPENMAVTERITIGLGVVNAYTRHPAVLAMETAALAGTAPGRVVLGLGSSNRRWIEAQMGIPFETPLGDLRECVGILRALLAGERLDFRGERFRLEGVRLDSAPKEAVPIVLGVKGPRALGLAGETADGVLCSVLASPAHVRRARAAAGAGPRFTIAAYVPLLVDDDGARAREAMRPLLARYLGVLHGQSILADAGVGPERTRPFRDALLDGEDAGHAVDDALVDTFAIAGTPAECRRRLERFAEAGLDAPVAVVPRGADLEAQIARIGAELLPAWRAMRCR